MEEDLKSMRHLTIFLMSMLIIVLFATPSFGSWLIYHKPAFKGKIIDSETREPIEGAVVVVIYEKSPLISVPGGGSPSVIKIRETLTDKKGEFYFSSYTTIIQPFAKEGTANFIIYKPGYASHPGWRIKSLDFVGPEYLFSKELGAKGEIRKRSKTISFTFGVVELPRLKYRKERLKAIPRTGSGLTK
jgi:hypothetical protein